MDLSELRNFARLGAAQRLKGNARGAQLLVTWDQATVYYLVVQKRKQTLIAECWGHLLRTDTANPLGQVKQHLQAAEITARRLILVLPRPELEMLSVTVPLADEGETAALIHSEVEQQIGDGDDPLVVDYMLLGTQDLPTASRAADENSGSGEVEGEDAEARNEAIENRTQRAVAFSLDPMAVQRWQESAQEQQWTLEAITSRQMAPLGQLAQEGFIVGRLTLVIAIYASEIELAFLRRRELMFLRTFRISNHALDVLVDQIQTEVQRSISMMELTGEDLRLDVLVLNRSHEQGLVCKDSLATESDVEQANADVQACLSLADLCETLEARAVDLQIAQRQGKANNFASPLPEPALVGAALDAHDGKLAIDLLHPKRPPVPPNPLYRWGAIGAMAAISIAVVGYVLMSDVRALSDQVATKQAEVDKAEKLASKLQEQGDEARFVRQWLGDQVDWLNQLETMTRQFPAGQLANVRRLSASIDRGSAMMDLSIQVSDPQKVAELEEKLRQANFSITSKQISEQANNPDYPWQFEARVMYPIPALDEREENEAFQAGTSIETTESVEEAE